MLIVARKEGQRIAIGEGVVVVVHRIKGGTVRLGIEAPQSTAIVRDDAKRTRREAA